MVGSDPLHEQLWTPQVDDVRCILAHQPGRVEQTIPNIGEEKHGPLFDDFSQL